MSNNVRSPMSRRGLMGFGLFAAACGLAGCGDAGGSAPTPSGKAAAESGSLKRIDQLKGKGGKAGPAKK